MGNMDVYFCIAMHAVFVSGCMKTCAMERQWAESGRKAETLCSKQKMALESRAELGHKLLL